MSRTVYGALCEGDAADGKKELTVRTPQGLHISIARCRLSIRVQCSHALIPQSVGPRLFIQRVPEAKVVKNRLYLAVRVGTGLVGEERLAALEAECARLVALGAVRVRLLPADGDDESCLVMGGQRVLSRLRCREREPAVGLATTAQPRRLARRC
jgi:hypothetical protein